MDQQEIIANYKINSESNKASAIGLVKVYLQKTKPEEAEALANLFAEKYEEAFNLHAREDQTDLARLYRLIIEFKPALASILKPGKEFDAICDFISQQFNLTLDRVRRELNEDKAKKKPGLGTPRKDQSITLRYFCTICQQSFEIPPETLAQLLNSDEKIPLPKHHDKEMVVKIGDPQRESPMEKEEGEKVKIEIYPAELLMQHVNSSESQAEYLKLVSVGIDVGSSTTHLVFSRLTLKRERSFFNMSNRFNLIDRERIYESNIIFTPLIDPTTIDLEKVVEFCKDEYKRAGLTPEQVDTGAVIVTGETAKKRNAAEIVQRLSSASGKFVSAAAGPNYESVLAAMGSGVIDISRKKQNTILNVDVGGGSSKLAIISRGEIISTSSINIGGRLLGISKLPGIDSKFKIWRIDGPTEILMKEIGLSYKMGDIIPETDVQGIAKEYAKALVEVMQRPASSSIAKKLMMTDDLDFSTPIDEISFSGGVSEMIYILKNKPNQPLIPNNEEIRNDYSDIGWYLAEEIIHLIGEKHLILIESLNKIRATVIGAGAFSLSVSGSTCYIDSNIHLPIDNVPVVPINLNFREMVAGGEVSIKKFKESVSLALNNYNLIEGEDIFALFFNDINIRANLSLFSKALEKALPKSFSNNKLIIIILGFDGAKMLGLTIKKETAIKESLFCLDELLLEAGDWIDIGNPFGETQSYPVTIKSLVFNQNKTEEIKKVRVNSEAPNSKSQPVQPMNIAERIKLGFKQFQSEHKGYESLLILTAEGDVEFSTDPNFLPPDEAKKLYKAWKEHEPAFLIGDDRYPIINWSETQFAARNTQGKGIVVGTKTKTNRYGIMKVDPGTKWAPNNAAYAVTALNLWLNELI